MMINKKKSGIIYHRINSKKIRKKKYYHDYPIMSEYKYLGVIIDSKLSFKPNLEYIRGKINNGFKLINIMKWKKLGTWRTTYVWMTYILPYLRYGSLVFRNYKNQNGLITENPSFKDYSKLYNGSIKQLYGLAKSSPNKLINTIMGSWNAETAIMQNTTRNINLWFKTYFEKL